MNPECSGFMASEPGAAYGSWNDGCLGGPVTGAASTCGPAHDAPPDTDDPTVEIVNPTYGTEFASGTSINIDANAFDAGWGIKEVRLFIDGMDIAGDVTDPYGWEDVAFPDGVYELTAQAEDHSGKIVLSAPVVVQFGEGGTIPPDPTSTSSTSSATDGDGEVGTDSSAGTFSTTDPGFGEDEGGDSGCACDVDGNAGGFGALALFGLLGLRRRRH
jgi:MYXO-CTERM domain-containing protein